MVLETQTPPFWPSRRLWIKFALSGGAAPINVLLLIFLFIRAGFLNGAYTVLFLLAMIGGPITIGVLLSPSWRGVVGGFLMALGMIVAWGIFNSGTHPMLEWFAENLLIFALIAYIGISILEVVTRDVQEWQGIIGLGLGGIAGSILSSGYTYFVINTLGSDGKNAVVFFLWPAHFTLVWLSVFFFTEFSTRRVGWGGALIWAGLIVMTFGVSMLLMR